MQTRWCGLTHLLKVQQCTHFLFIFDKCLASLCGLHHILCLECKQLKFIPVSIICFLNRRGETLFFSHKTFISKQRIHKDMKPSGLNLQCLLIYLDVKETQFYVTLDLSYSLLNKNEKQIGIFLLFLNIFLEADIF